MIKVTIDVILISLMRNGTKTFPVLMLLTDRLYLQIIFLDRLNDGLGSVDLVLFIGLS